MNRFIPISVFALFLAVPGSAEINDDVHASVPRSWLVSEETLTAKVTETRNTLSERVARLESTVNEKMARMESQITQRVARVERTLNDRVAALRREVSDLRANVEATQRQTGGEAGEKAIGEPTEKKRKPSPQTSRSGEDSLSQRSVEIEKALTELRAQVKDVRGRVQDLRVSVASRNMEAGVGRLPDGQRLPAR